VALTVTIVAAAGLLIRSVLRLQSVDLGLAADRLVLVNLDMPQVKYGDRGRAADSTPGSAFSRESSPDTNGRLKMFDVGANRTERWPARRSIFLE
jgi:hypothetical protein